jgi:RimJ/RimL family protein N-acetyltransferase
MRQPVPAAGLTLRPWQDEDAAALIAAARDPELRRWTSVRVDDEAGALRWLGVQHTGWGAGTRFSFAVLDDERRLVANVALKRPDPAAEVAEVGYWTAAYARGRGVAPRAVESLTGWAFATFAELTRLELLHQVDNTASCRVAAKSGYPYERTLPARDPYPREGHMHTRRRQP